MQAWHAGTAACTGAPTPGTGGFSSATESFDSSYASDEGEQPEQRKP